MLADHGNGQVAAAREDLDAIFRYWNLVGKKGISYFKFTKRNIVSQRVDIGDRPTLISVIIAFAAAALIAALSPLHEAPSQD